MSFRTHRFTFLFLLVLGLIKFSIAGKHECELEFSFGTHATKGLCIDSQNKSHKCVRSSCGYDNKRYVPINGCTLFGTKAPKTNPTQQQCEQYKYPSLYNNQQLLCTNGAGVSFLCPATPGKVPSFTCQTCDD